ncbi:hypothetical protein OB920_13200 [Halobacteria archaeon HArc-gm2]|nr:hypothetical protein [Halobacteria archaeon HArc-gm2]
MTEDGEEEVNPLEDPAEFIGGDFNVGEVFRVTLEGKPDFAEIISTGHIRPATAAPDGFTPKAEPYWEYRVRYQSSEEWDVRNSDAEIEEVKESELKERLDVGVFERVREQSSIEDF